MDQKGFTNIILVVIIVILVGVVGYFALVKKSEPVVQQPTPTQTKTPTPTRTKTPNIAPTQTTRSPKPCPFPSPFPPPSSGSGFRIFSPNGGEIWRSECRHYIQWIGGNDIGPIGNVIERIYLLKGGHTVQIWTGPTYLSLYSPFDWRTPPNEIKETLTPGNDYKIRVTFCGGTSDGHPCYSDESDAPFSIVTTPNN